MTPRLRGAAILAGLACLLAAACRNDPAATAPAPTATTRAPSPVAVAASPSPSPAAAPARPALGANREALLAELATLAPGVTDTEIKIGTHTPLSGPAAGYQPIPRASQAWFRKVNEEQGGVHGRRITFLIEDDAYRPPQALQVTRKLVEQDQIFALYQGFGTAPHSAVVDYLIERRVPDLFPSTGASKWSFPPKGAPPEWSTLVFTLQPDYVTEGTLLARHALDTFRPKTYAVFMQNDDFGKDGADSFGALLEKAGVRSVGRETYEITDPTVDTQVIRLREANPDVLLLFSTPLATSKFLNKANELGWRPQTLMTTVSADPELFKLTSDAILEGIVSLNFLPLYNDANDPRIAAHHEFLSRWMGGAEAQNYTVYGQCNAQLLVEMLRLAGRDLNRASLIRAGERIQGPPPEGWICPDRLSMSERDHRAGEAMRPMVARNGRFTIIGDYLTAEPALALPR